MSRCVIRIRMCPMSTIFTSIEGPGGPELTVASFACGNQGQRKPIQAIIIRRGLKRVTGIKPARCHTIFAGISTNYKDAATLRVICV